MPPFSLEEKTLGKAPACCEHVALTEACLGSLRGQARRRSLIVRKMGVLTRSFCPPREVDDHKSLPDMLFCLLHVMRGRETSVRRGGAMRDIFLIHVPWLLTGCLGAKPSGRGVPHLAHLHGATEHADGGNGSIVPRPA